MVSVPVSVADAGASIFCVFVELGAIARVRVRSVAAV